MQVLPMVYSFGVEEWGEKKLFIYYREMFESDLNQFSVVCYSFQELDLSKEAFFFNDTPKELEWTKAVSEALHPDAKYALVRRTFILIFVLFNLISFPWMLMCNNLANNTVVFICDHCSQRV